jgi:hypothetical protein
VRPGDLIVARWPAELYRFSGFRGVVGVADMGDALLVVQHDLPPRYTNEVWALHPRYGHVFVTTAQFDILQRAGSTS